MEWVGVVGVVVSLAIALWQHRRAVRAEEDLPKRVASAVNSILSTSTNTAPSELHSWPRVVSFADVDGDGREELLVQYPVGAHGSALKVFGWRAGEEFAELGDLSVGTGAGFDVGDFDGDGRLEIRTEEADWNAGMPYATAPRFTILYRWNGKEFVETARHRSP